MKHYIYIAYREFIENGGEPLIGGDIYALNKAREHYSRAGELVEINNKNNTLIIKNNISQFQYTMQLSHIKVEVSPIYKQI